MASRLSDTTNTSSDDETPVVFSGAKRKYSYNDSPQEHTSKISCLDTSYNYFNRESDEIKEDDVYDLDSSNVTNYYDKNYSNDKSNDSSEEASHKSYRNNDYKSKVSNLQFNSSKINKNFGTIEKKSEPSQSKSKMGSVAERMMKNMGYKEGLGLGKELQGRAEPIATSTQKGRRGLGLKLKELEKAHLEFDPKEEIVEVQEELLWLDNQYEDIPLINEIVEWENERRRGERKDTIDGETIFCDEIIIENIINSKSVFDRLDKNEMREARTRSNPFETIRGAIFLNRAAVKMANIDKACDFMFTQPLNLQKDELLYFADVCAGPGGFSEYVLWRKKWHAKGFGFTLKNENDFKLDDFHAGPCETFHPYYGPKDDGDVYDPENQKCFRDLVMNQTDEQGVHFMMADGGFSVEGKENIQEILSKQLYLCQCLVALMIVRPGGHFVTKVFDLFTPFSAGLIYIMYRCFSHVSIFKPNTSRPANSERYLICKGKKSEINHIVDYLYETNKTLLKVKKINDILELVPIEKLLSDKKFFSYFKNSNEALGQKQIVGLKKIAAYTENKSLFEHRQKVMREKCLKYWGLPDQARTLPRRMTPIQKVQSLLKDSLSILEKSSYKDATKLEKENIFETVLANEHDWFCMPCSSGEDVSNKIEDISPTFYVGMGRSQVYKYDKGSWKQATNLIVELPRDTLVYAEPVMEMRKEERSQTKTYSLHILDAFMLGSENISQKYLTERVNLIQLFCKALWKPADRSFAPVRVKELFSIDCTLKRKMTLELKTMKNNNKILGYFPKRYSYENDNNEAYYYVPRNIIFFKATEEPWARHKSSSNSKMYFYNKKNRQSFWEIPDTAKATFAKVLQNRVIWNWPSDKLLSMDDFVHCLQQKYSRQHRQT